MKSNIKIKKINSEISSIIIDEPKTYNSLSFKNLTDLLNAFKKLDADKQLKVIILEGAGKGFSAGHNLKEVRGLNKKEKYQKLFNLCSKVMLQIVEGRKPVIAKVHGAAFAAGCQLVASCDLAYSTRDALFATPGVNIGLWCLTPMVGISRAVGKKHVMQMLAGGELHDADFAFRIGLINQIAKAESLESEVKQLADGIASKSGYTLALGKNALYRQMEMNTSNAYEYAGELVARNMFHNDAKEGIKAFLEKRDPVWQGRKSEK